MAVIITASGNGLKFDVDGNIRYLGQPSIMITSVLYGTTLTPVVNFSGINSASFSTRLADITTIGGNAPSGTVSGLMDQLTTLIATSSGGGGGSGSTTPITPVTKTTSYTNVTTSGTIATGTTYISILNVGNAAGTVKGVAFPIGAGITWPAGYGELNDAVAYDATGTQFLIGTRR